MSRPLTTAMRRDLLRGFANKATTRHALADRGLIDAAAAAAAPWTEHPEHGGGWALTITPLGEATRAQLHEPTQAAEIAESLTEAQRRALAWFLGGGGHGGRSVVLRSLQAKGLAYPTNGWKQSHMDVTVTPLGQEVGRLCA